MLRPFVLIATAFVVMGSVASLMIWVLARAQSEPVGEAPPAGSLREVSLRPVPFPDAVPEMERRRLVGLLDAALAAPSGAISPAEQEAVAAGLAIVPPALDRLYALSVAPGFADSEGRRKAAVIDRILRAVQVRAAPNAPPARPPRDAPEVAAEMRARAWLRWWDERSSDAASPTPMGNPR